MGRNPILSDIFKSFFKEIESLPFSNLKKEEAKIGSLKKFLCTAIVFIWIGLTVGGWFIAEVGGMTLGVILGGLSAVA